MNRNFQALIILLVLIAVVGAAGSLVGSQSTSSPVESDADSRAVRGIVTEFGARLKNVSLLAPQEMFARELEENYGNLVTPELLAAWENDPSTAPGRQTSSPWPDRIEIVSVVMQKDGSYAVEGNVIEVTSVEEGTERTAAVYPVSLTLRKVKGEWRISSFDKGSYSELPKEVAIIGKFGCIPHKNTSGPQTLECGLGIEEQGSGIWYSLDMQAYTAPYGTFETGKTAKVTGTLVPVEALSSDVWQKYNIKGIIRVTAVEEV